MTRSAPVGTGVVPVVARYQSAISDMSHVGATGAGVVTDALGQIDLDKLRPVGGKFDLAALGALAQPLGQVRDSLLRLQDTADAARSDWLVHRANEDLHLRETSYSDSARPQQPNASAGLATIQYLVILSSRVGWPSARAPE